jgi:hypothetical protein
MFLVYESSKGEDVCSREEILTRLRRYVPSDFESMQRTRGKELASKGCGAFPSIGEVAILIDFDEGENGPWHYMHIQSDEFVCDESVFQFVREAGLIEAMEEEPRLLS